MTQRCAEARGPERDLLSLSDKVGGSPALKQQAATADLFVIATAAAKHAATEFIMSHRPKGARTLFAAGQGSASMIECFKQLLK